MAANLVFSNGQQAVTTSLVIAQETDNEHASVLKLLRTHLSDFEDFGHVDFKSEVVNRPQGGGTEREYAILNEHQATLLIAFMRNSDIVRAFKKALVKAFFEFATAAKRHVVTLPYTLPEQEVAAALPSLLAISELLGVPLHLAQIEAVKSAARTYGYDATHLLVHAPAQQNIADTDVMLEPTELAEKLGVTSARKMNTILCKLGLQVQRNGEWEPTTSGATLCARHAWINRSKSGYNLKWRVDFVRRLLADGGVK